MRLIAFRIKNFRSIVDTDWQNLSPDNITCLIGQNESGKTSVLEAFKVFYTGVISEDILRSDMSLPEVSCRFSIPEGWLVQVTENPGAELKELLSGLTQLELTRKWIEDLSSEMVVSGKISQYLDSLEDAWKLYLEDVKTKLQEEMGKIKEQEAIVNKLSEQIADTKVRLSEAKGNRNGFSFFGKKAVDLTSSPGSDYYVIKNQLTELKKKEENTRRELLKKETLNKAGNTWLRLEERCALLDRHFNEIALKLEERHQKMTLLMRPINGGDDLEWNNILSDFRKTRTEKEQKKEELDRHIAFAGYLMEGCTEEVAAKKVNETVSSYKSYLNSGILGNRYFEYCPVFEMFEDFGSLLPNRIDLDDIISGNRQVEGYKAARNFLNLAQLDYTFFDQPSSRILKQKIENLNHSLTRNFQDFWQQSIGRNNKINIQFELDHYNSNNPAKAGKPYLEFWIKDEGERLYPKQRSRGVRWFLSFYMELKASASGNRKPMVLLVDEPGVSLHARAQEDVLKVFEDISQKIQIIYTTHSPHLVEIDKLHRVLAVQRDDADSYHSTTRILDPVKLSAATPDTLTPLQSILGNPMVKEGFLSDRYNLIVNDIGSFYLLSAILQLTGFKGKLNLVPSTDVASIPLLCNILTGWGMKFAVLLFKNENESQIEETLRKTIFNTEKSGQDMILELPDHFLNAEDLLSTLDFKNHILKTREGITVSNSVYIRDKEISRNFVLSRFLSNVKSGKINIGTFDEESLENFKLFNDLLKGLK
jgi:ABC-type cobalamin/Fe3+-siderophores transport system ATPase subunit